MTLPKLPHLPQLPQLPQDKANHFAYGALIAACAATAAQVNGWPVCVVAGAAAVLAGLAKELIDLIDHGGPFDLLDAAATAAGALPVLAGALAMGATA